MIKNDYVPFSSKIVEVIKHTEIEFTFRMEYQGEAKPGQFFEVSIPKFGEAPISISGIGNNTVDLTIRKVGKVTDEIFEHYIGERLLLRGPYGNGFDVSEYEGKEIYIVAGGTGLSPVRGVVEYFYENPTKCKKMTLISGFKSSDDILFSYDIEKWKKQMNVILTVDKAEKGSRYQTGLVTAYIPKLKIEDKNNIVIIVVGPPAMMKFSVKEFLELGIEEKNIWISQERKMCCGLGKCGHCKIGDVYVCIDGPVFNYVKGKELID
ncbi:MAG: anaerobic sulfite reductase subunit AsrB [Lachnospiraceae bacterium]